LIGDERDPPVFDRHHQVVDQPPLLAIAARAKRCLMQNLGQLIEVLDGRFAERRPDLEKRALDRIPEHGAGQRLKQ